MKQGPRIILITVFLLLTLLTACGKEAASSTRPETPRYAVPQLLDRQIVVLHSDNARELSRAQIDVPFVEEEVTHVYYVGRLNADGRPEGEGTLAWSLNGDRSFALYCESFHGGHLSGKFRYASWKSAVDATDFTQREFIEAEIIPQAELQDRFGAPVYHGDREYEETLGGMTMRYVHENGDFAGGELREGSEVAFLVEDNTTTHRYRQVYWRDDEADQNLEVSRMLYGVDC